MDVDIIKFVAAHRTPAMAETARDIAGLASPAFFILLFLGAVLLRLPLLRSAVLVVAIATAADAGLKELVGRDRPLPIYWAAKETGYSFPSGHSTAIMAFWLYLGLRRRELLVPGMALVFLVGLSRVVLCVHYPTDVLSGWFLGALVALGINAIGPPKET